MEVAHGEGVKAVVSMVRSIARVSADGADDMDAVRGCMIRKRMAERGARQSLHPFDQIRMPLKRSGGACSSDAAVADCLSPFSSFKRGAWTTKGKAYAACDLPQGCRGAAIPPLKHGDIQRLKSVYCVCLCLCVYVYGCIGL